MANILILNGPNLNLLGSREPEIYGSDTLASIFERLEKLADQHKEQNKKEYKLSQYQSNSESDLVDQIHQAAQNGVDFILINPAAFTHTSIALRDALLGTKIPFIEIHLSNVHQREEFRQHSYFSDIAVGTIVGLGAQGYELALQAALRQLETT